MIAMITAVTSPSALSLEVLQRNQALVQASTTSEVGAPHALIDQLKARTGIVSSHLAPLQRIAAATNSIIGIRPVESVATGLIEAGHPTKDFHIKGKSANWGPQSGLICTDQAFSKLEQFAHKSPETVAKANAQILDCIEQGHAVPIPLKLSRHRIDELVKLGQITGRAARGSDGTLQLSARGPSQQHYEFQAHPASPGDDNYLITHNGKALHVLAKQLEGKALTADYDLHMIAPHLSDFGAQDKLPVPDIAHSVFRDRVSHYQQVPRELSADFENAAHFYRKENPDLGNITPRIEEMIGIINRKLVGDAERVVHHNADSGSPATDVAANYPATFFLPAKLGRFDEISIIHDSREMAELIKTAKDSGYHVPLNPLWEKEVVNVRRSDFTLAKQRLSGSRQA
ncbi:anthrax toxin-like adenylyl cyclase domain-containing protein [Pseudomonas sp. R11-23-07]|uniref:anthrax toxin-like adenylyl cyclase domain-containing protein n=1 Tax=Pseudomonas sp. R11-23-07 TaxID=658632 RepID=UPI000F566DF2|nr:anthrax toxin-like adenylyl cyclase domain-containing protein [Pseudomonas sp. R11-23-07]AZF57478.1 Adenylate cyclase ExoY [Pseudomonas sp. R11-23-07]